MVRPFWSMLDILRRSGKGTCLINLLCPGRGDDFRRHTRCADSSANLAVSLLRRRNVQALSRKRAACKTVHSLRMSILQSFWEQEHVSKMEYLAHMAREWGLHPSYPLRNEAASHFLGQTMDISVPPASPAARRPAAGGRLAQRPARGPVPGGEGGRWTPCSHRESAGLIPLHIGVRIGPPTGE